MSNNGVGLGSGGSGGGGGGGGDGCNGGGGSTLADAITFLRNAAKNARKRDFCGKLPWATLTKVLPGFDMTRRVLAAHGIFTVGQLRGLAPTLPIGRRFINDHLSFLSPEHVFTMLAAMSCETLGVKTLARALLEGAFCRGNTPFTPAIFANAAESILAAKD